MFTLSTNLRHTLTQSSVFMQPKSSKGIYIYIYICLMSSFVYVTTCTLKEIISQTDQYLVNLSSKTYVFEDKLAKS